MVDFCKRVIESDRFNRVILTLIVLSGLLAGIETYPEYGDHTAIGQAVQWAQNLILLVFVLEIAMKVIACGSKPWEFFSEPWNLFDFIIVAVCLLPLNLQSVTVVRMARILRAMRMITVLPRLRLLVTALLKSIPSLGYIGVLLGLHFYIYAVMGTLAFSKNDPIRFGSLHVSATTLFQVLTLEGWNDVRDTQVLGSDATYDDEWKKLAGDARESYAMPVIAHAFFITFILLGTMIMLNLFTGVIISSMEEAQVETSDKGASTEPEPSKGFMTLHEELAMLGNQLHEINGLVAKLQQKVGESGGTLTKN